MILLVLIDAWLIFAGAKWFLAGDPYEITIEEWTSCGFDRYTAIKAQAFRTRCKSRKRRTQK